MRSSNPVIMMTRLMNLTLAAYAAMLLFALTSCAPAQLMDDWEDFLPHSGQSIFNQISRAEVLEMTLVAPLDSLVLGKYTNRDWPATFRYVDDKKVEHSYRVQLKARGKFRRKVCDFPPLKLNFSKKELQAAGLESLDKMKLVTHCFDNNPKAEEVVLREYLAYKLYNQLTPNSFRVQLVKVTYQDSYNPRSKTTRWGFLIEDDKELAQRIGGEPCDCMGQEPEHFSASQAKLAAVFEFMIGNTDWDFNMSRNLQIFKMPNGQLVPVPYDFDFAVIAGAPYARPNSDVNQSTKMERIYMGHESNPRELYSTFAYFNSQKQEILRIVRDAVWLKEETRVAISNYLESFYMLIQDEKKMQETMINGKVVR